MTRLAARGVLCQNNLADPKCLGYEGHLDAFCIGENLADPKCSEYTGHEKAKLDAFCIGENLADPKCSGYDGHEKAKLNAFCETNLANPDCSEYDGHLNAFCETNLANPDCSEYDGHLTAFCTGENLADPKCEEQPAYALRYLNQTATYAPRSMGKSHWRITNSSGDHIGSPIFVTNVAGTATMEATAFWRKYPGYNATFDVREVPDPNTDTIWQATCEVDRKVGFCV